MTWVDKVDALDFLNAPTFLPRPSRIAATCVDMACDNDSQNVSGLRKPVGVVRI
jgi:hypothetical protein